MVTISIALVQFDAVPEKKERNLEQIMSITKHASSLGARWIVFHENSICDCTSKVAELAEPVPNGMCTRKVSEMSRSLNCYVSFGLIEKSGERHYISQVFVGPDGYFYYYRKTWLCRDPKNVGYRNEWVYFDPGTGPELFEMDGLKATCFICADGEAPRCIERAAKLTPQIVFYPNNRATLPRFGVFGKRAGTINAPMLVTNRVGFSWDDRCMGGCVVYSVKGEVLAKANRESKEEILTYNLEI